MTGTPHIEASPGDFAETVLMPGDPLRAQALAEKYLADVRLVNRVRNMLGFTGTYKGRPVSIMGSGMGMPSISIYAHELFDYYGVKQIIRIGTCGGLSSGMKIGDLVMASAASTDSAMNRQRFAGWDFSACADFELLRRVDDEARRQGVSIKTGNVFASDWFYHPDEEFILVITKPLHNWIPQVQTGQRLFDGRCISRLRKLNLNQCSAGEVNPVIRPSLEQQ